MPAEAMNSAKDPEKDFLGKVERLIPVPAQVDGELDDHPLMLGEQFGVSGLLALSAALYERDLAPTDVRPACNARLLQWEAPKRRGVPGNFSHYSQFRPPKSPKVPGKIRP